MRVKLRWRPLCISQHTDTHTLPLFFVCMGLWSVLHLESWMKLLLSTEILLSKADIWLDKKKKKSEPRRWLRVWTCLTRVRTGLGIPRTHLKRWVSVEEDLQFYPRVRDGAPTTDCLTKPAVSARSGFDWETLPHCGRTSGGWFLTAT